MGVEYAFLPNWSAKIEYNYIDYRNSLVQFLDIDELRVRRDGTGRTFRSTSTGFNHGK